VSPISPSSAEVKMRGTIPPLFLTTSWLGAQAQRPFHHFHLYLKHVLNDGVNNFSACLLVLQLGM
jgi:hypothetical protein